MLLFFSCGTDNAKKENVIVEEQKPKYTFTSYEQKISYCIGLDHGSSSRLHFNSENTIGKFNISEVEKGLVDYLKGNDLRIQTYEIDSIFNLYLANEGRVDSSIVSCANASYAYGISEANVLVASLVARGIDQTVVVDLLVAGIEDGMRSENPSVSLKDARIEVVSYYSGVNKDIGERFLNQNTKRENVITTETGLQYEIFGKGNGPKPNITDTVIVHYTGRFVDGREFESTVPSKIPAKLTLLSVIPGWTEGLQLMNEGGQYRFFIPFELAYGEKGNARIEPYSALVFDIELIGVIKYVPNN
jgi:FKBP-type peptidyl-prolyl cis-trans isomerase